MFKRVFVISVLLFLGYNGCLFLDVINTRFFVQSQWQENLIKAQEYLVEQHPKPYVIVGSSLTARMHEELVGQGFYNLAFSGGSVLTGLEIIARRPDKPKIVFVETNVLLKGLDQAVLDNAFRPGFSSLRKYLPAFREKYQPANLVAGKLGAKIVAVAAYPLSRYARNLEAVSKDSDGVFEKLLGITRAGLVAAPDAQVLETQIQALKQRIGAIQAAGAQIVFVEMPIDSSLEQLASPVAIRQRLLKEFPESRYDWIRPEPNQAYTTTDGLHLTLESLTRFAGKFSAYAAGQPMTASLAAPKSL